MKQKRKRLQREIRRKTLEYGTAIIDQNIEEDIEQLHDVANMFKSGRLLQGIPYRQSTNHNDQERTIHEPDEYGMDNMCQTYSTNSSNTM